jgi:hypothetical protein
MTTYRDTLNRAATLLESSPDAWTQNQFAHDRAGNQVPAKSPQACSWCTLGAIKKVAFNEAEVHNACTKLQAALRVGIAKWNDAQTTDKSIVIAKLREVAK